MKRLHIFLLFIGVMLVTGCVDVSTKYVAQQQYALNVAAAPAVSHKIDKVLEIYAPNIAPQFAGTGFVYRTSELEYTSDFYNVFFTQPAEQFKQNMVKYLQGAKIFKFASDDIAPLTADYVLKSNITELYADYRDKNAPKAVISVQFVFLNTMLPTPKIIFSQTFHANVALQDKSSTALVYAWNKGLQSIFSGLVGWVKSRA